MAPIDPAKIEAHKTTLGEGKVHLLRTSDRQHEILVRSPGRAQWRRFTQTSVQADRRIDAVETLVRDCLLEPSAKEFEEMLEAFPALGMVFGDAVADLAGAALSVEKNG